MPERARIDDQRQTRRTRSRCSIQRDRSAAREASSRGGTAKEARSREAARSPKHGSAARAYATHSSTGSDSARRPSHADSARTTTSAARAPIAANGVRARAKSIVREAAMPIALRKPKIATSTEMSVQVSRVGPTSASDTYSPKGVRPTCEPSARARLGHERGLGPYRPSEKSPSGLRRVALPEFYPFNQRGRRVLRAIEGADLSANPTASFVVKARFVRHSGMTDTPMK